MLSLYIHIPFCAQICKYCSFSVLENQSEDLIQSYLIRLHQEIDHHGKLFPRAEIKSLYFWGGTPNLIWAEELIKLIDHCVQVFNCEDIAELSFEFNPYPSDQILELVKSLNKTYQKRPRVRYSFWIQSFDNAVLSNTGRPCTFPGLVDFLRCLQPLKQENNVFNFDFIAFGKFNQTKKWNLQLRTQSAINFFSDFTHSWFADSFSLYTLELFENQRRKKSDTPSLIQQRCFGSQDEIYEEFSYLKEILLDAGYSRYEISNFSLLSKSSIHNRVYWEMEEYLGLGLGASSFLHASSLQTREVRQYGARFTNTPYLPKYLNGETTHADTIELLQQSDFLIEKFFLGLMTDRGVQNTEEFTPVLISDYQEKLWVYEQEGLIIKKGEGFVLSDRGMDCYNSIITTLLKEI